MELTERQTKVFKTIVEEFTRTAEPVGSHTLMNLLDFHVSSATLRNEMAALEEMGLLEKTHTSSGRIPSSKGYRYYVDHLMVKHIEPKMMNALQTIFDARNSSMEEVVRQSCDILSQMTNLTSVALGPDARYQSLQHITLIPLNEKSAVAIFVTNHGHTENKTFQFSESVSMNDLTTCCNLLNENLVGVPLNEVVDRMVELQPLLAAKVQRHEMLFEAFVNAFVKFASDQVYFSGQSNMLYQPEFADIEKLKKMMSMLEDSSLWRQIAEENTGTVVRIGKDNVKLLDTDDVSVVASKFKIHGDEEGQLMIVGPTRMPYNEVVALMEYISRRIEEMFNDD
ncbi:heat-inducible transcriptional repressor HrcA [uncultured Traorella sp.]|uniref:heat-inducible transcriptional repressor HrcA n=1 Tax=uncultured Traorella sp. TaxID=1929048 RepID=UPI0025DCF829|nr:heat-inducible transcriptional repressor HrcA [uncultured Traorella sp.]